MRVECTVHDLGDDVRRRSEDILVRRSFLRAVAHVANLPHFSDLAIDTCLFCADAARAVDELFNGTKTLVEATLKKLGLDPEAARAKSDDAHATYTFGRGSAHVLVGIVKRTEQNAVILRVAAPVMLPPEDEAREQALYERLLELNGAGLVNCAFALIDGRVVVVSERPVVGLDEAEVEQILKHTSAVADTYDDRLVDEFGGRRASDPDKS